jgi:hypothetical protein
VAVFAFDRTILLMGVGIGDTMSNAQGSEGVMYFLVFATPIRLSTLYFSIEKTFNVRLKLQKDTMSLSTVTHQINLGKFVKIINEVDVIFKTTNR